MLEFRAQVPYDERYQEQFNANDDHVRAAIAAIVRRGIDRGEFRESDPDRVARILRILIDGARMQAVVLDREATPEAASGIIDTYLSRALFD